MFSIYLEDTADVRAAKEEFFKVFLDATNGLIKTVENFYIEGKKKIYPPPDVFCPPAPQFFAPLADN